MSNGGFNTRLVRDLAKILRENDLSEIEVDHEGTKIVVSRQITAAPSVVMSAPALHAPPALAPVAAATAPPTEAPAVEDKANNVPSPMVGTVYLQAEPGTPSFIRVGETVKEGQQLFIIEAMKTMNPVFAPKAGTVKGISVTDGQPVEFGETLCVIA